MTASGWGQAALLFALVALIARPLGLYLHRVYEGERTWFSPVLVPCERAIYRLCRIDPANEMDWKTYAFAVLAFSLVGLAYLYALLRLQGVLPLNPQHFPSLAPDLAWNTAVSFTTNTNWQFYSGESTLGYLSQTAGLGWHMFVSAAAGMAIAIALVRGFARANATTIGNFWVDLVHGLLYVLLPLSFIGALILVQQGVPMNFSSYTTATTLEGATQTIPQGPMASQESIKELGTNGGGFVNGNSAAPFENPTPFTNFLELLAIIALGAAFPHAFGRAVRDARQGGMLFGAMGTLLVLGFLACYAAEAAGDPLVHALGVAGGNMEGKETRFGISASALWAVVTTATSCGAVNAMHDSFTALGGLVPLANMQLGEVVFGGAGAGLYGALEFVVLTVFIAGLMVGRTPEYLGKKIERREVLFAILATLVVPVFSLVPAGIAAVLPASLATLGNAGPHGFSEILYAYTSGVNNNGSAFAGLSPNAFWNVSMGLAMLFGRFAEIVPVLALAGALAAKRTVAAGAGTLATHTPLFAGLWISVVLIVGALTFFPADSLGPIVEHFLALEGKTY
ncbi:MAG: potassium-transporting ATPase subunit KdpA [Vulcanimicrobiaceae bacterium]